MIAAVIERCAGIDVGKKVLAVCIMTGAADAEPEIQQREFSTFNRELNQLRNWLAENGCTHVVMESTGSYWRPVLEILEDSVTVILANPEQVKSRRGHRRTGMMPAGWPICFGMTWCALVLFRLVRSGSCVTSLAGANRYCAMPRANGIEFRRSLRLPM
jgi:hypothetical protein